MLKPTKILVPTDFSEYSDKALKQALDIAVQYKAKVYILHVVSEKVHYSLWDDYPGNSSNLKDIKKIQKQMMNIAKGNLVRQLDKFQTSKDVEVVQKVIDGIPFQEILREQEKLNIDLIVIASLGRTGIAKFLIGGVARNVLKGAKCPVLLTK